MAFCVSLLSLSIIFSRFICVVVCVSTSFLLWLNSIPLYGCTAFIFLFISWWTCGLLPLFVMNNGVLTFMYRIFVWTCVFHFLEYIHMNGFAGSYDNSMFEELPDVFQSGYTFYISARSVSFQFFHILTNISYLSFWL